MEDGRIRQIGAPHDIYEFPNSRYVAEFIGSMNIFEKGVVIEDEDDFVLIDSDEAGCHLYVTDTAAVPLGSHISVAIRPEKVMISSTPPAVIEIRLRESLRKLPTWEMFPFIMWNWSPVNLCRQLDPIYCDFLNAKSPGKMKFICSGVLKTG